MGQKTKGTSEILRDNMTLFTLPGGLKKREKWGRRVGEKRRPKFQMKKGEAGYL